MKPLLILALLFVSISAAQIDRSKMPGPAPAPAVAFPDYDLVTTSNGMKVIIVRNDELPTIQIRMLIDREPILEGEYAGYVSLAGQLMRNGTTIRTKDQLDEEVDQIGATIGSSGTSVFGFGLSRYTEKIIELMADVTLNPSFPQEQLDKLLQQRLSFLKYRKTEPNAVVDVLRRKQMFGANHPYGEIENEETLKKISREKSQEMYQTYFKPNYAIMAIVGDVEKKKVVPLIEKYFGSWKKGTLPTPKYENPKPFSQVQVALCDRPSSVQSVIRVAETVSLPRTSPDVTPVTVMNTVLGGGIFRLFLNLREKHAYTYGAYSSLGPDELIGTFTANTSARNIVTDSALTEIFYELRRIRDEKVEDKELQMAKNYLSGSFARSLEEAATIANYALEIERYDLPKDYYKTYLKRIEPVTADDVQRTAKKYLDPDKMLVAVVGSATEVKEKLKKFGPITMCDENGNPIAK
jgi:predicted Zn-dependent peptidase